LGMTSTLPDMQKATDERWRFWRDVLVFELKMFIGNLRDFALMPVSVVAAMIDLVSKGEREGSLFYRVLRWGAHSEEVLDAYSPIRDELQDGKVNPNYTVDAVVARLEGVLVREYEKGGTAATIKAALDRAIDQLHRETENIASGRGALWSRQSEEKSWARWRKGKRSSEAHHCAF
jgi:hypothetical protein